MLGGLLAPLAAADDTAARKRGKRKRSGKKDRKQDGKQNRKQDRRQAQAEAARCCSRNICTPGPGKNLGKCCYEDRDFSGQNFRGANLGRANFAGADLTNANLRSANLGRTCFVDADTTGARFGRANTGTAIFCRTITGSGEDNSGCGRGTRCCPTCDAEHPCGDGEVCCAGRCVPGDCCDNDEQGTCGAGKFCCNRRCVAGDCCAAADCPNEVCQRRACEDNQCVYMPVSGSSGPGRPDPRICCEDAQRNPVCCDSGVTICQSNGICGCASDADCGGDEVCCAGQCERGVCCQNQDCPQETCQERECVDQECDYTPVFDATGPDSDTVCCRNAQGGPVCCEPGVHICQTSGLCGCKSDADCGADEQCCGGQCVAGVCCQNADCPEETCWSRECRNHECAYTPVSGTTGPDCSTVCCQDAQGGPVCCDSGVTTCQASGLCGCRSNADCGRAEVCCDPGTTICQPSGICGCGGNADCGENEQCCGGVCQAPVWANQTTFGSEGSGNTQFTDQRGVAVSADALTVWVADTDNDRVSVWSFGCPAP